MASLLPPLSSLGFGTRADLSIALQSPATQRLVNQPQHSLLRSPSPALTCGDFTCPDLFLSLPYHHNSLYRTLTYPRPDNKPRLILESQDLSQHISASRIHAQPDLRLDQSKIVSFGMSIFPYELASLLFAMRNICWDGTASTVLRRVSVFPWLKLPCIPERANRSW